MLPLRLGTVNANGPQDLIVYALTRNGRVEATQLSHGEAAVQHRRPALRQARVRQFLQGDVRPRGRAREHARGVRRIRLGHGLVRSLRRRPPDATRSWSSSARAGSAATTAAPYRGGRGRERLRDAPACALRREVVPRGSRVHGNAATAATSRAATCCAIPGKAKRAAMPADQYHASLPARFKQEAKNLAASPAGRKPRSRPGWKPNGQYTSKGGEMTTAVPRPLRQQPAPSA